MLLALNGLLDDYSHVRYQIWESPLVPNFISICFILLCVPGKSSANILASADDSFALVSQRDDCNHIRKPSKGHR